MVPDTWLRNDPNVAAECFVTILQQQDVFLRRQIHIGITVYRNDGDAGRGDRCQGIDRIRRVRKRLCLPLSPANVTSLMAAGPIEAETRSS
jgi:hypothetical protein